MSFAIEKNSCNSHSTPSWQSFLFSHSFYSFSLSFLLVATFVGTLLLFHLSDSRSLVFWRYNDNVIALFLKWFGVIERNVRPLYIFTDFHHNFFLRPHSNHIIKRKNRLMKTIKQQFPLILPHTEYTVASMESAARSPYFTSFTVRKLLNEWIWFT